MVMNIDILFVGVLVVLLSRSTRSVLMAMAAWMHEIAVSPNGVQRTHAHRGRAHQPRGRVHLQDFVARITRHRENLLASVADAVSLGQPGLQDHKALGAGTTESVRRTVGGSGCNRSWLLERGKSEVRSIACAGKMEKAQVGTFRTL